MSKALDASLSAAPKHADVTAPIVGSIWQILIEVGEHVDAGQTLMILESMKMEIPIVATHSGTVSAIPVKQTEIVQEGDVVTTLAHP